MVWMGFTCILWTNTFLVGRYWDFNSKKKYWSKLKAIANDTQNGIEKLKFVLGTF